MKHWLLWTALLPCHLALGQRAQSILPPLPDASLQTTVNTTAVSNTAGKRYQYQLIHLYGGQIWLAPAWRGKTKLEPPRKFIKPNIVGELDGLLMATLNDLAAEGWELLEIQTTTQPTQATQKVERELQYNDPERPVYKATTSISTSSQTRYLFRKAQ